MNDININISSKEDNRIKNKRRKYNNKLLKVLKEYIKENPDFRFIQALTVLSIVSNLDRYNEESEVTFHRVQNRLQQMKNMKFHAGIKE